VQRDDCINGTISIVPYNGTIAIVPYLTTKNAKSTISKTNGTIIYSYDKQISIRYCEPKGRDFMKLCFNATTLRNFEFGEAMRFIRNAGYTGVEISLNDTHLHPLTSTVEQIRDAKKLCNDLDLEIACVAAGGPALLGETPYEPSLITADAKGRQARFDAIRKSIELTNHLSCPVLNINSGLPTEAVPPELARSYFMEAVFALIPELGPVTLVIEPEPNFFVGTTAKAIEVIREINSPKVLLNLDIGHVFCSEEDCYDAITLALPYTRHVHIEDIKGNIHFHEIPGEGDIDFQRVAAAVISANYPHFISVELHNHDQDWRRALDVSHDYLIKLFESA